jgi:hypothetical protein
MYFDPGVKNGYQMDSKMIFFIRTFLKERTGL